MSGAEIVGAVASVSQLVNYIIGTNPFVFQLHRKLREAPARFKQQTPTLEDIGKIAHIVRENKWSRNKDISVLPDQMVQKAEQVQNLLPRLDTHGFPRPGSLTNRWRAFKNIRKDEPLLETIFVELRDRKSSLALDMANLQISQTSEAFHYSRSLVDSIPRLDKVNQNPSERCLCINS